MKPNTSIKGIGPFGPNVSLMDSMLSISMCLSSKRGCYFLTIVKIRHRV